MEEFGSFDLWSRRSKPQWKQKSYKNRYVHIGRAPKQFIGMKLDRDQEKQKRNEAIASMEAEKEQRTQDRKRDMWIGPGFNHRVFEAYGKMEEMNKWMSELQKAQTFDIFKAYRKKVYWILVNNNMMPGNGSFDVSSMDSLIFETSSSSNEEDQDDGSIAQEMDWG